MTSDVTKKVLGQERFERLLKLVHEINIDEYVCFAVELMSENEMHEFWDDFSSAEQLIRNCHERLCKDA